MKDHDSPLAQYFVKVHNGKTEGLKKVKGICALKLLPGRRDFNTVLLKKEKMWIYMLNTLLPKGLKNELSLQFFWKIDLRK